VTNTATLSESFDNCGVGFELIQFEFFTQKLLLLLVLQLIFLPGNT